MVSLGSIFAAFLYPVLVFVVGGDLGAKFTSELMFKIPYCVFSLILASLAIYRHRSNIDRLLKGTENKLWKTQKEKAEEASKQKEMKESV